VPPTRTDSQMATFAPVHDPAARSVATPPTGAEGEQIVLHGRNVGAGIGVGSKRAESLRSTHEARRRSADCLAQYRRDARERR
jgi:hypothetical protein